MCSGPSSELSRSSSWAVRGVRRLTNGSGWPMTLAHKLWEARSWLYRSRLLQVNTRLKALDEIYNISTLMHRLKQSENHEKHFWQSSSEGKTQPLRRNKQHSSEFKNSTKFHQTFSQMCRCIFKFWLIFCNCCPKFTNVDEYFYDQNILFFEIPWYLQRK